MSGLERLRKFAGGYPYTSVTRKLLVEIADEIERDMRIASCQMWTQIEGKPVLDDEEEFTHWLDRWYLMRPE